jgi:hypothetical protein
MTVPQDGDCALHVIMRALPGPAMSATTLRAVLSRRVTTENFREYKRKYIMTSAPHIRDRISACDTAQCLRTILEHTSYYLTNDDLTDIGDVYGFYPIIVNQKYNDASAGGLLRDMLLLCDPFNTHEGSLRQRFFEGEIPAILFYNRSDIAHYESLEYHKDDTWTGLVMERDLDATLRRFIQTHCTLDDRTLMNANSRYMMDIGAVQGLLGASVLHRTPVDSGEIIQFQLQDHRYTISVSTHYPMERPSVDRDGVRMEISSFWTTHTTLIDLLQTPRTLDERYHMYLDNHKIVRSVLIQAFKRYEIQKPGLTKMRRFALCMYIAEFETTRGLCPFTQIDAGFDDDEDNEDFLAHGLLNLSL